MVSSDSLMLVLVMTIVILPNSRLGQTVVGVTMAGELTHQNPPRPTKTHQGPAPSVSVTNQHQSAISEFCQAKTLEDGGLTLLIMYANIGNKFPHIFHLSHT